MTAQKFLTEISSCGVQSPFLSTCCSKNRDDDLVRSRIWRFVSTYPEQHRQHCCLRLLVHTKKSSAKSPSLNIHGNVNRYLHWHCRRDEKLVENERQTAFEQRVLTETVSGFLRAVRVCLAIDEVAATETAQKKCHTELSLSLSLSLSHTHTHTRTHARTHAHTHTLWQLFWNVQHFWRAFQSNWQSASFLSYFSSLLSVLALGPTVILRVNSCLDLGPETGRLQHV